MLLLNWKIAYGSTWAKVAAGQQDARIDNWSARRVDEHGAAFHLSMAGGDAADLARAQGLLADLGQCTHMGPVGAGQVTKMVNQVLVLALYIFINP